ncbi:MAG: Fibronectin type protein [Candidatus Saccharibacteria bacterium]|nr:Fibronectin type protein [Candidatus Saccharibacteria bacterium]
MGTLVAARTKRILILTSMLVLVLQCSLTGVARAADTTQNPQAGSVGLEGSISTAPPTRAATITTPANGTVFTSTPITVAGLCTTGNLIKVFDNNVFVGSTLCVGGSYSLKIDLFSGGNQLVVRVYDALDQAGPDSNTVNVTFNDAQYAQFGSRVTVTSIFARRGAYPGDSLVWPLILNGGSGPYAISVDWGDGSSPVLQSQSVAGSFDVKHSYTNAGVYTVTVRATDKNGVAAFLQLVAVANGATQAATAAASKDGNGSAAEQAPAIWWPTLLTVPLLLLAFWVGRRHELYVLRKTLEAARRQ